MVSETQEGPVSEHARTASIPLSARWQLLPSWCDCAPCAEGGSKGGFSLQGALGGGPAAPPTDLGVIGRGTNRDKTGRLNKCDNGKKGCISTFEDPDSEAYIPPWTYQPGFSTQAISPNDARRETLRREAGIDATTQARQK